MLQANQAQIMLQLQDNMNAKVNPEWLTTRSPFLRAVVIEGAEAIEHHGWKWWKKQDCDLEQLQMELVDIWHFVLSELLLQSDGEHAPAQAYIFENIEQSTVQFDGKQWQFSQLNLLEKLELLIGLAAAKRTSIGLFSALLVDCKMSWLDLYQQYVSKNVLNFFRQDNGYKQGTYRKVWDGREDNEHLVELMANLDASALSFQDDLYQALHQRYGQSK
ncbi:dUTP diphosphatase [Agarivorans sp. B2Z047]|uniref:Dimeric dUTPase n=1 Tax=Agarivorans albus MKT 106 TaxID=1331007 RepID=R9PUA5_AGAAL|nr:MULTISPECIES: dUTP diphosphatase [Agarivorans]MPW30490.1 dUTP diphosphatase [Agarivorans sp. B2Z047]UQN42289.1 dUTP diphosphatase [Agarivorans sp. B2Z047]GAD03831.1 dimeric dUTPase [Agarivorans albus MKT 106]